MFKKSHSWRLIKSHIYLFLWKRIEKTNYQFTKKGGAINTTIIVIIIVIKIKMRKYYKQLHDNISDNLGELVEII